MSSHALGKKDTNAPHLNNAAVRFDSGARNYRLDLPREAYKRHDDRIIRRREEQAGRKRYGGARREAKPYDRYNGASWREKKPQPQTRHDRVEVREATVVRDRLEWKSLDRPDGSYGHQMRVASPLPRESAKSMQADREASALQPQAPMLAEQRTVGVPKRIASAIVTPSRGDSSDGNVTKRFKGTPRSLAFETLTQQDPKPATEDEQVIEALNDMDITVQLDGGMMDCEMQNDDLMGLELAEMEEKSGHERADHGAEQISQKPTGRSSKHIKHGYKSSASLGGQTKKFEILLRGSPQKRSSSTQSQLREDEQVIEALNDMDIAVQLDGGMMDCEMQNDDLMGLELAKWKRSGHERADHGAEQISGRPKGRGEGEEPFEFKTDEDQVIDGLDRAVMKMKKQAKALKVACNLNDAACKLKLQDYKQLCTKGREGGAETVEGENEGVQQKGGQVFTGTCLRS
ncbi:hypothetical protein Bca52824_073271 [Brassica carinata]|uniref:PPIase FKBP-type domain-containing protein n=1 Tax=Brassica carinata TaxID=52824 RepID=A0A8X7U529_BRACI|nr:hypothetical protein Bca52824_073271 [Brassica carinata]